MTDTNLRLVVSLDAETQGYRPEAHNLTADQAVEHLQRLQPESAAGAILVQEKRHKAATAQRCQICKKAAEQFAERLNQAVAGMVNPEQEPAPVGGGEETEEE